ncbi:MAG TPA: FtsX-like permease family protein, partial [Holophaga sp.]|nr:FtsX-like permease family protein [Holophaga sp.]
VIVSYNYWMLYLGSAADLSPFHLRIEGGLYPVVGVMPDGFDYPSGTSIWTPGALQPRKASRTAHNWRGLGRIRSDVTLEEARADLGSIARRIGGQYGKHVDLNDAAVVPLAKALVGDVQTALFTLLGAVGLLLLVACANVAGLLVARGAARRKELALRVALGAGRGRILQQFLVEAFALSLAGGALGLLLAAWAIRLLPAILPANLPRQQGISMNTPVLLFAVAAVIAVSLALGLLAAWRAGRGDLQQSLASGSRAYTGTGASQRLRGVVVTGEIAATLVILIAAGLLGRSFLRLVATSPGFHARNLITMQFSVPIQPGPGGALDPEGRARQVRLLEGLSARLRALPGVETVGVSGAMPVAEGDNLAEGDFLILNGQKPPADFEGFQRISQNPAQVGHALYA